MTAEGFKKFVMAVVDSKAGDYIGGALMFGLEHDKRFKEFVEQVGELDPRDCIICKFHEYGKRRGWAEFQLPPRHRCPLGNLPAG